MIDCFFIGQDPRKYYWLAQYRSTNEIPEISQNQDSETKMPILEGKKILKLQATIIMNQSLFSAQKKNEREREKGGYQTHLNHYIQTKIQMKNEKDSLLSTYYAPDTFTYHLLKFHDNLQVIISNLKGRGSKETSTFLMHSAPQSS